MKLTHDLIERKTGWLILLVILTVSVGGLVEIVPLFFQRSTTEPVQGLKPYPALQLAGRDIYVREGCYNCHSQMVRPFRAEVERYGPYSVAGEIPGACGGADGRRLPGRPRPDDISERVPRELRVQAADVSEAARER